VVVTGTVVVVVVVVVETGAFSTVVVVSVVESVVLVDVEVVEVLQIVVVVCVVVVVVDEVVVVEVVVEVPEELLLVVVAGTMPKAVPRYTSDVDKVADTVKPVEALASCSHSANTVGVFECDKAVNPDSGVTVGFD